eukprot:8208612-Pyramimonas_sp.AAC.1
MVLYTPQAPLRAPPAIGRQTVSNRRSAPSFGFGSADKGDTPKRFHGKEFTANVIPCSPGPTVCANKSSMGLQPAKKSNPGWLQSTERRFVY